MGGLRRGSFLCPTVTFFGGDNDICDLTLLGANFAIMSTAADINGDGIVSIFDLVMVGANFGKAEPSPWPY